MFFAKGPKSSKPARPQVFVLVGGTGDLALRMLWPSLAMLDQDGFLAKDTRLISVSRESLDPQTFAAKVAGAINQRVGKDLEPSTLGRFTSRLKHLALDANRPDWGSSLRAELGPVDELDIVFFLSTSPKLYKVLCDHLRESGLNGAPNRVVIEKPIGSDLASSCLINDTVAEAFEESRVFRIDHYLGKETVQNLLALRFANTVFEPLWNASAIDHVQITVAESVGVGERLGYYDDFGALRDMVQNHLLQLLCLVAMEPPSGLSSDALRDEKVKVLKSLKRINEQNVQTHTARGQYTSGLIEGTKSLGYIEQKGSSSETETFVAIKAEINNWRWAGVPFYLRTGKCLPSRKTEIVVQFKPVPHSIFKAQLTANRLVIHLQPEEDIALTVMNKSPGLTSDGMQLENLALSLTLVNAFDKAGQKPHRRRIAYERLILDALCGNNTHFVRRDEVEAAWEWIDGIIDGWKTNYPRPHPYPAGTFGPMAAYRLFHAQHTWNDA